MQPGDIQYSVVTVSNAYGVPQTGLVTADFTVVYYFGTTTHAVVFTATELGAGRYRIALTLPATRGFLNVFIASGSRIVENGRLSGEIENQDLDSIYGVVVRPQSQLTSASTIASEIQLVLNGRRYKALTVSVVDQNGAAIDLSAYTNWRFSVWDRTHTASAYSLASGITGTVGGLVSWAIPESATFFSAIDTAIAAGDSQAVLYYDMIADAGGVASSTESIFRGQLIVNRWEGAA